MISPLAPVTTDLHKRGGHIIHNGCVPIDVEVLGGDFPPCPVTTALHGHMAAYIYMWGPCNYSCMLRMTMR